MEVFESEPRRGCSGSEDEPSQPANRDTANSPSPSLLQPEGEIHEEERPLDWSVDRRNDREITEVYLRSHIK